MELSIYSPTLDALGVIDEITSLLWTRRYNAVGEFSLLVPFTDNHVKLLQKNNLIAKKGDDEIGQIRYINIRKNLQGMEEIEVQGRFITQWLNKRIVLNQIIAEDTVHNIMCRIVDENIVSPTNPRRIIPNITIAENYDIITPVIPYISEPYISALTACENMAKSADVGFKITTNLRTKKHCFVVYKGRDLSAEQTENPQCVFSHEFDNVLEQELTDSVENLRTTAYVVGEFVVEAESQHSGLDRDEIYIDASELKNADENTLIEYSKEELSRHNEYLSFTCRIDPNANLRYKEDFDVGDIVTCVDKRWGVKLNARISEVSEIYQSGNVQIDIVFGDRLPMRF